MGGVTTAVVAGTVEADIELGVDGEAVGARNVGSSLRVRQGVLAGGSVYVAVSCSQHIICYVREG